MSPPASAADRAPGRSRAQRGNVLISGAGPAGLTLAYWLSRHGFCPTVVERAPAPRDGGQAVDIRGAAIDVASRAGILGAGGCQDWDPADKPVAGQPETASAESGVRPGPRPRHYARTTANPRKPGRVGTNAPILPADSVCVWPGDLLAVMNGHIRLFWVPW